MARNKTLRVTGSKLYYGTAAGSESTQISGIDTIDELPKRARDEYEITRIDQEVGGDIDWDKQFDMGYADNGNANFTLGMDEDQTEALEALDEDTVYYFKVLFKSGATLTWPGLPKERGFKAEKGKEVLYMFNTRVTGRMVFTKAA